MTDSPTSCIFSFDKIGVDLLLAERVDLRSDDCASSGDGVSSELLMECVVFMAGVFSGGGGGGGGRLVSRQVDASVGDDNAFRFFSLFTPGIDGAVTAAVLLPPSSAAPLAFNFFKKLSTASGGLAELFVGFAVSPVLELLRCIFGVCVALPAISLGFLLKSNLLFAIV